MTWVTGLDTPLGPVAACGTAAGIQWLYLGRSSDSLLDQRPGALPADPLGLVEALRAWLSGRLDALDGLPVDPRGTPFQLRVWAALREIPPGRTLSYGELARRLGSVARAVGAACGANPVAIVVPCHRVLGARGELTGYAGGLQRKQWLLAHEGAVLPRAQGSLFPGR